MLREEIGSIQDTNSVANVALRRRRRGKEKKKKEEREQEVREGTKKKKKKKDVLVHPRHAAMIASVTGTR
jgi:hypothetical protein